MAGNLAQGVRPFIVEVDMSLKITLKIFLCFGFVFFFDL